MKLSDGKIKGRISFYCNVLEVSRQEFYDYLDRKDKPWKYASLVEEMLKILGEDEYNDCYGRKRMYMALLNKKDAGKISIDIPCDSTVRNVMEENGLIHKVRRKPNGITKADREAHKSDDLIKRDFSADKPLEKAVTDISELKGSDGKVYVSAVFDCFDLMPLGLAIEDNMKSSLCRRTLEIAVKAQLFNPSSSTDKYGFMEFIRVCPSICCINSMGISFFRRSVPKVRRKLCKLRCFFGS